MTLGSKPKPLMTYDEAAEHLGIQRSSVKQLVSRGHLRSVSALQDRRRRLLLRSDVETYAQTHAGKWAYNELFASPEIQDEGVPVSHLSKEFVTAGLAASAAAFALILAFRATSDTATRVAILAAISALALVLFLEWRQEGKLDADRQRRLEKLAKQAEVTPEPFLAELESLLSA